MLGVMQQLEWRGVFRTALTRIRTIIGYTRDWANARLIASKMQKALRVKGRTRPLSVYRSLTRMGVCSICIHRQFPKLQIRLFPSLGTVPRRGVATKG